MEFLKTKFKNAFLINFSSHTDDRGSFFRFYCENEFKKNNINVKWVQINHSINKKKGTLRGMHFQVEPYSEIKLVRCIKGSIFDVIVDLRKDSDTYLQWQAFELSPENNNAILIPKGFAHGFQTLEKNSELIYFHSEYYNKEYERGLNFDDKSLNIKWPLKKIIISDKDSSHPKYNKNEL